MAPPLFFTVLADYFCFLRLAPLAKLLQDVGEVSVDVLQLIEERDDDDDGNHHVHDPRDEEHVKREKLHTILLPSFASKNEASPVLARKGKIG